MERTRGPVVSLRLLLIIGIPVALFCSFVLTFASDACGLSGRGNWACGDTVVTATFVLPVAGLAVGVALNAAAIAAATRRRSTGGWLFLAWTVPVAAGILGFTVAGSMAVT
jgi:hypothetical protein